MPEKRSSRICTTRSVAKSIRYPASSRLTLPFGDLSAAERNVLVARIVVGFDVRETALSLRTTTSAVELAQHRALAKITTRQPERRLNQRSKVNSCNPSQLPATSRNSFPSPVTYTTLHGDE